MSGFLRGVREASLRSDPWRARGGKRAHGEELREVFLLYTFQGLKYREIADLLEIPLGTVMSRLHRARSALRERLREGG